MFHVCPTITLKLNWNCDLTLSTMNGCCIVGFHVWLLGNMDMTYLNLMLSTGCYLCVVATPCRNDLFNAL